MSRPNRVIFLIFWGLALFLYFYRSGKMFAFDADQEFYANQFIQTAKEHKLTLLGIETSTGGMFVGPLYTYISSFVYLLFHGDPLGIFAATLVFSSLSAGLTYYFMAKLKGGRAGFVSGLLVLFSASLWNKAFAPSPINFLYPMGLVFFYTLVKLKEGERYYWRLGIILALTLQIHFSLFFFFPITAIFLLWRKLFAKKNAGNLLKALLMIITSSLPLIFFDLRHHFLISGNLGKFLTQTAVRGEPISVNIQGTFWGLVELFTHILTPDPGILVYMFLALVLIFFTTRIRRDFVYQIISLIYIVSIPLFIFYRGPKPDYFFHFLLPPFFLVAAEFVISLKNRLFRYLLYVFIIYLLFQNLQFINTTLNHYNFRLKTGVAKYISEQSSGKKVKISYDTDLGLGFGFDYLLKHEGVNIDNTDFEKEYHIVIRNYADYPGKEFKEPESPVSIKVVAVPM